MRSNINFEEWSMIAQCELVVNVLLLNELVKESVVLGQMCLKLGDIMRKKDRNQKNGGEMNGYKRKIIFG